MTTQTFSKAMMILNAAFPQEYSKMDKNSLKVWFELLKDLDDVAFVNAVKTLAQNSTRFPSIAEIRKAAESANILPAEIAWEKLYEAIHEYGYYLEPTFDDPILESAKRSMGWQMLCDMKSDEVQFIRAQFLRTYNNIANYMRVNDSLALKRRQAKPQELAKVVKGLASQNASSQSRRRESDF